MGTRVGELEKTYSKIKLRMLGAKLARRENTMAKLAVLARRRASEERNDPHYWAEAEEQKDLEE